MTLDEAIKHAEEVAEEKENEAQDLEYSKLDWRHEANQCFTCAEDHRQLAEWLKELKRLKEQEPCEDAISRQAVLVTARNSCADLVSNKDTEIFCDEIKALPPVTSQSKTGEWIFVDKAHEHAHCSECDYGDVDLLDGRPHNYCPNCGAKMVEPQAEKEG